ncbi:DivIVA domain-containing protein [Micromonospora sp. HM5-17]|uniref:DivIVA domain-containing protein n=1 Tax=Micromonospora sp. HM5-17 TaxID=2487710 RepID=UPI000F46727A|nr:DivIVA domain-containing protein [Micromonospora sp. HM5-17]ROT32752.1 DivIVA domain-containing protein [Micromonospora sp. HM5-17]
MASHGQRFRRKALRRGYKVEEVDSFLDRVEATLAGEPIGEPVAAQEVHDVVFRVRFGGYDEWQVDLHLDRVERQIAELEERRAAGARAAAPRRNDRGGHPDRPGPADRPTPPERMTPADRMGPPDRMGPAERFGPPDRMGPPMRDDRGLPPGAPPPRPMAAPAGPPGDTYGQYDEPTGAFGGFEPRRGAAEPPRGGFEPPRGGFEPPRGGFEPRGGPEPQRGGFEPPRGGFAPQRGGFEPRRGGFEPQRPVPPRGPGGSVGAGFDPNDRFDGFAAGRRAKADMTAEIRMPERELRGPGRGFGDGPVAGPPPAGPPPAFGAAAPPPGPGFGGPGSELARIDQIRRTFQVRRFGSGYDPVQVDRLFEEILNSVAGRGPMPVNPNDLDTLRFELVPGGYFEAEVDAALKEVKDLLLGR